MKQEKNSVNCRKSIDDVTYSEQVRFNEVQFLEEEIDKYSRLVRAFMRKEPKSDLMKEFEKKEDKIFETISVINNKDYSFLKEKYYLNDYKKKLSFEIITENLPANNNPDKINSSLLKSQEFTSRLQSILENIDVETKEIVSVNKYFNQMEILYSFYNDEDIARKKRELFDIYCDKYLYLKKTLKFLSDITKISISELSNELSISDERQLIVMINNCKEYFKIVRSESIIYVSISNEGRKIIKTMDEDSNISNLIYNNLIQVLDFISGLNDSYNLMGLSIGKQYEIKKRVQEIKNSMTNQELDLFSLMEEDFIHTIDEYKEEEIDANHRKYDKFNNFDFRKM